MIVKLCAMAIVLAAVVYAYPAEEALQADLVVAKGGPVSSADLELKQAEELDQPDEVSAEEDEGLKGAESGWGGWGWGGGYGRGYGGWGWGGLGHGYGGHGWGGYGGYGGRGWGGWGGHGGWGKRYYKYWG